MHIYIERERRDRDDADADESWYHDIQTSSFNAVCSPWCHTSLRSYRQRVSISNFLATNFTTQHDLY